MKKKKETWTQVIKNLRSTISKSQYETWFSNTKLKELNPDLALIEVPNKFVATWIQENYLSQIQKSFKKHLNIIPEIRLTYDNGGAALNREKKQIKGPRISQDSFGREFNPSFSFDSFLVCDSNKFAHSSAFEVAKRPGEFYNPLFIFSNLSLGKTHLLNAIGNHVTFKNSEIKIGYISTELFKSEFSRSHRDRKFNEFREKYRNLDILLLDDIHLMAGRRKTQDALISLFNYLYESKKQVVVTSKLPPNKITDLNETLKSRLEWGLISEIESLDQKTKIQLVKSKAKEEGLNIPEDALFFLANSSNDIESLLNYLVRLQTSISLYHRKIDISTVKSIIKKKEFQKIGAKEIKKYISEYFNLSPSELLSNKKSRNYSYPRQMAMYLCRKLTTMSLKEIGNEFGRKDHSTVIYALKRIENEKEAKGEVMDDLNRLQDLLS